MHTPEAKKDLLDLTRKLLAKAGDKPANIEEADKIVKDLQDVVRFHDWNYYVQSKPLITDRDYDTLFKLLKEIEQQYPDLCTPDSPTQRVAQALSEDFPAVEHNVPMLSLENSYDEADLREF